MKDKVLVKFGKKRKKAPKTPRPYRYNCKDWKTWRFLQNPIQVSYLKVPNCKLVFVLTCRTKSKEREKSDYQTRLLAMIKKP